jgi:hypothetical protein
MREMRMVAWMRRDRSAPAGWVPGPAFLSFLLAVSGLLPACTSISLSTDFECGRLGRVERRAETRFVCALDGQADREGRNRQVTWYCFRIDGARGREVEIVLTDLRGEYNYRPARIAITDEIPPVVSADGRTWTHLQGVTHDATAGTTTLRLTPAADRVWVAHIEPYGWSRLLAFLGRVGGHPHLRRDVVGKTVEDRDLILLTITDPAVPDAGKRVAWLMARQHAWESGTSFVAEGAVGFLLSDAAAALRRKTVFKIFPMLDPDGVVHGAVRFNRNGFDVNRHWDSCDPASGADRARMPEIWHVKRAIHAWQDAGGRVDLFLALHNQEKGGWLSGSERHGALAAGLFAELKGGTTCFLPGKGPVPPGRRPAQGRMAVHRYLDLERGLPAFLLEQGVAFDAKLGRFPTSKDRLTFGRELAQAMARVLLD